MSGNPLGVLGALAGGVGGFFLGGPAGAMAGAGLGSQIGGQASANDTNVALANAAQQANQASADKAMAFEKQEAENQRQYQTYMANTERQRAVADLKAAGLNPLLAGDTGAATPVGASAKGVQAQNTPATVDNEMAGALSGALDLYNAASSARKMRAEADGAEEGVKLTKASTARTLGGKDLDAAQKRAIEAQRAKDRAIQPLYDAAGNLIERAASGVKDVYKKGHQKRRMMIRQGTGDLTDPRNAYPNFDSSERLP